MSCLECGSDAQTEALELEGIVSRSYLLCVGCTRLFQVRHERQRLDTDELLTQGLHPHMVSRIIIERTEKGVYDKPAA